MRDGNGLGELRSSGRHAQTLVQQIGELLRTHGLKPHDVQLLAVSKGPGSFTGLRVGMVCAKTFVYATGCRFIAVDTFAAIAENCASADVTRLFVIEEDAQRDDLFVGEYHRARKGSGARYHPFESSRLKTFFRTEPTVTLSPVPV